MFVILFLLLVFLDCSLSRWDTFLSQSYPAYQFKCEDSFWVYDTIAELWRDFLSEESIQTIKKGMYYTELIRPGLRLVALNTAVLWGSNMLCPKSVKDPGGQFAWLRSVLSKSKQNGEKIFLMTHIPMGVDETEQVPLLSVAFNDVLADTLNGFYDIITGSFFGHVHVDSFRIMCDTSSSAASVGLLQAALTPHPHENPAIAFFTYNTQWPFTIMV